MSNQIPLSGAANAAGGYLLPPEQGEILVNGILVETGAIQLAGDARSTSSRKTNFPIWLGRPTAGPVSEGAAKPVTGAAFGQSSINVQKFASIVLFTDEQIEDLQNGDLNVLVDAGVRQALSVSTDAHAAGLSAGQPITSVFDSVLAGVCNPGVGVQLNLSNADGLQTGVSAAMGQLEANGYGDPADMGVLLGFGLQQKLRDARDAHGRPLYDGGTFAGQAIDALYGLDRAHSTNLASTTQDKTCTGTLTASGAVFSISASPNNNIAVTPGAPITGTGITGTKYIGPVVSGGPLPGTPITGTIVNADGTLATISTESAETLTIGQPIGVVVHKPNIHVRVRQDVSVGVSNEASIVNGGTTYNLFQENLTAVRYELRIGYLVHDQSRAIIPLFN
ncbi:MAG: phage major capsid protein [Mycobacteriaceae bacterium]